MVAIALTYPYQVVRARIQVHFTLDNDHGIFLSLILVSCTERRHSAPIPRHTNMHQNNIPTRGHTGILQRSRNECDTNYSGNLYYTLVLRTIGLGFPFHSGQARGFEDGGSDREVDRRWTRTGSRRCMITYDYSGFLHRKLGHLRNSRDVYLRQLSKAPPGHRKIDQCGR